MKKLFLVLMGLVLITGCESSRRAGSAGDMLGTGDNAPFYADDDDIDKLPDPSISLSSGKISAEVEGFVVDQEYNVLFAYTGSSGTPPVIDLVCVYRPDGSLIVPSGVKKDQVTLPVLSISGYKVSAIACPARDDLGLEASNMVINQSLGISFQEQEYNLERNE